MACRFYDRLARRSPCEGAQVATFQVRLCDYDKNPIPKAPFRAIRGTSVRRGIADDDGFASLTLPKQPEMLRVEWTFASNGGDASYPFGRDYWVNVGGDDADADAKRLFNLGYLKPGLTDNVNDYQRDFGHPVSGELADISAELRAFHDGGPRPDHEEPGGAS